MKNTFFILLLSVCINLFSQDSLYQAKSSLFASYPQEQLYLQTSKDIYDSGEDLWFKVYHLDAYSFGRSTVSQTLYLEMVNDKDSIVWQEKYQVNEGITSGHVYLSESLPDGNYNLRACTRNSCYDDTLRSICQRRIQVVKFITGIKKNSVVAEKTDSISFGLYPEGGYLVHGLPCRVAFKGTDGHGHPIPVEGSLYESDTLLTTFQSFHDGMGSFMLIPDMNKQYFVQLKNGKKYLLPEIQQSGMTMQFVRQTDEAVEFYVLQSAGLPAQKVCLVGQLRGVIGCIAEGVVTDRLKISVPLKEFPYQGIAEFTLYNAEMQPLSERLVYIHPEKKLTITAKTDKEFYGLREKAVLHITVKDEGGNPVPNVDFGVSVFDNEYENLASPVSILSYNYLSSQLRGEVYNAPYYFDKSNTNRLLALDLLLLTQGWRRYVWSSYVSSDYEGKPFLTEGITGKQIIPGKRKAKRINGLFQVLRVSTPSNKSQLVEVDTLGNFNITPDILSDMSGDYLYLKPMLQGKYNPKLRISEPFAHLDSLCKLKPCLYWDTSLLKDTQVGEDSYHDRDGTILLDEVRVIRKKKSGGFRDKFLGELDSLMRIDSHLGWVCPCAPLYLNDYFPGYTHHPSFYDGIKMLPVDGKKYRMVKYVFRDGYYFVEDVKDFIYSAPTYSEEALLRMSGVWKAKSYYRVREFYQPDETDMQISTPDARNTLLWNPSVVTNSKGEATVHFYCSDINTKFICRIEGIDNAGLLGSGRTEFRVYKKDIIQEIKKEEHE